MAKLARLPRHPAAAAGEQPEGTKRRLRTRYHAFLSYSHVDKELANWLHRELEKFHVPAALAGRLTGNGVVPRRLTPVFRDQHDLSAGDDLAVEIEAALAASQFLIVLCSPTAARSRWTNLEIESFKRTRPEGCVLAAIASGEPFASDLPARSSEECFPPALRFKYDRRGHPTHRRAEPLAADFRGGPEARRTAFLKLVAGMLGVGLDELVQREQTSRHRRLALVAAASIAGMAVTSGLAVTAVRARNEAQVQRGQAEALIEFMLGDLRDKLEPIGKLNVLDGVGSRVLAYYSNQDMSQLSDNALVERSKALNLMAEVAYDRGSLNQAEDLYRQAVAGTAEAVRRAPNDAGALFNHAQNVFWVGEVAREAGRPSQSEAAYREYKRIADRMTLLQPDNLKYRMEVLYANEDVGISLYDQHQFQEASRMFTDAASQMAALASLYPSNRTYQKEHATVLAWAADAERAQGNLDAAIALRGRQIDALEALLRMGPDSNIEERLVVAHQGLGVALTDRGELEKGAEELGTAASRADSLVRVEPGNADWKSLAARVRLDLAATLLSLGEVKQAAEQTQAACSLAAALPTSFAIAGATRLRTSCAALRTRLALATGAAGEALAFAGQALASARTDHSEDPITDKYRIAQLQRLLGDARQGAGDADGARSAWKAGLAAMPQGVAERPWETNEHLLLCRRLGLEKEAQPLFARLRGMNYRPPM